MIKEEAGSGGLAEDKMSEVNIKVCIIIHIQLIKKK